MNSPLTVTYLHPDPSPQGPQAVLAITEPNGDVHVVRCLVRGTTVDLGGEDETLRYLFDRYGMPHVMAISRRAVVGPDHPPF